MWSVDYSMPQTDFTKKLPVSAFSVIVKEIGCELRNLQIRHSSSGLKVNLDGLV